MVDPLLSSEELFSGHGWRLTLEEAPLPDGRRKTIVRARQCDRVHILAITGNGAVLLLKEFRPFYGDYLWMLPTGKVDKEDRIEVAALRELREETGQRADELEHYFSATYFEGLAIQAHVFVAKKLHPDPLPQDATELMEVHAVSFSDAIEKVQTSPVIHTISAYALLRYAREHGL